MRIAFFSDSYKPYLSGVTISIETLVKELRELGHRVYVFAPRYHKNKDEDKDIIRFPSISTGYPGFKLAVPYLKDFPEIDIIHAHSPFQTGLLGRYLARKKNIPFVYTFHTLFTRYVHYVGFLPKRFSKLAITTYIREFCRRTDLILAPSQMSKRVLRKWGIFAPCEIVPTGINVKEIEEMRAYGPKIRKQLNLPEHAEVLVYLGRISEEKNISFLLDAFKILCQENRYMLLIGGGPLLKTLKDLSPPNVIFTGELEHRKALEYCAAGDLFVFASLTETQGLVLAEAKAMKLPIVALFAGGLVDTVRSGTDGYLTNRNIDAFVLHARRLLEDHSLRSTMGQAAFEDARESFSSVEIAKQIETLYNSLISKKEAVSNDKFWI